VPEGACLGHFGQQALRGEGETGGGVEFRDQVVVIGIEPLGHLERVRCAVCVTAADSFGMLVRHPARQREVTRQRRFAAIEAEARRLAAEQRDMVRHVVVEGEVADGDEVQSRLLLLAPVALAQRRADRFQRRGIDVAAPVALEGKLQFALQADAGIT
jgi:hypothetical protein